MRTCIVWLSRASFSAVQSLLVGTKGTVGAAMVLFKLRDQSRAREPHARTIRSNSKIVEAGGSVTGVSVPRPANGGHFMTRGLSSHSETQHGVLFAVTAMQGMKEKNARYGRY